MILPEKKLFERGEKYYFENMGIRNVITGVQATGQSDAFGELGL